MSVRRPPLRRLCQLALVLALLAAIALVASACGDEFEGTWKNQHGEKMVVSNTGGENYELSSPGDDQKLTATRRGDTLTLDDPTGTVKLEMTVDGDTLTMGLGDQKETLTCE